MSSNSNKIPGTDPFTNQDTTRIRIKIVLILFSLSLAISLSLQAQTVTNELFNPSLQYDISPSLQSQTVTNTPLVLQQTNISPIISNGQANDGSPDVLGTNKVDSRLSTEDIAYLKSLGYSDADIAKGKVNSPQQQQATISPTPPDLKNAGIWMDNFLGTTNANIMADVISMKPDALKFRCYGQDYDYSGHYTVMLNTPRQHKNPYFGFGSPETAKILILENVGGDAFPLQNATIWEKSNGFIDAVALDKEWIYSGTYTIQN